MGVCIFIALYSCEHKLYIWCLGAVYTMEIALKFRTEKSCISIFLHISSQEVAMELKFSPK